MNIPSPIHSKFNRLAPEPTKSHNLAPLLMAFLATVMFTTQSMQTAFAYEQRIAILFGFEKYEGGEGKGVFRNLPFATNDLESVATALHDIGFDRIEIFTDARQPRASLFQYRSIRPDKGTLENQIVEFLNTLPNDSKQKSLLLIYFTGHGGVFNQADRMLALPDTKDGVDSSYAEVWKILEMMTNKATNADKLLVIDACADKLGPGQGYHSGLPPEAFAEYLFSSRIGQMSFFDRELQQSIFTHYFVDALYDIRAQHGKVTLEKVYSYVKDFVPTHPRREQRKRPGGTIANEQVPYGSVNNNIDLTESITPTPGFSRPQMQAQPTGNLATRPTENFRAIYGREK